MDTFHTTSPHSIRMFCSRSRLTYHSPFTITSSRGLRAVTVLSMFSFMTLTILRGSGQVFSRKPLH